MTYLAYGAATVQGAVINTWDVPLPVMADSDIVYAFHPYRIVELPGHMAVPTDPLFY